MHRNGTKILVLLALGVMFATTGCNDLADLVEMVQSFSLIEAPECFDDSDCAAGTHCEAKYCRPDA